MCGSRPRICVVPSASSGTAPRSDSRKAFGNSSVGTRRRMDVSAEHLVEQARERFQLQDYYGAVHLLEEVVAAGRAFADAHHVLGLSYSLVGQQDQALAQLDRALALGEYQQALTLGPAFHDLRYKLGHMLLEAGRALDAHEHFEIIVRARPTYLDAAAMLGLACYLAGDGLAVKAVWEECRERRPEDPRVEAYLAMLARNDVAAPVAVPASGGDGDPPTLASGRSGR